MSADMTKKKRKIFKKFISDKSLTNLKNEQFSKDSGKTRSSGKRVEETELSEIEVERETTLQNRRLRCDFMIFYPKEVRLILLLRWSPPCKCGCREPSDPPVLADQPAIPGLR